MRHPLIAVSVLSLAITGATLHAQPRSQTQRGQAQPEQRDGRGGPPRDDRDGPPDDNWDGPPRDDQGGPPRDDRDGPPRGGRGNRPDFRNMTPRQRAQMQAQMVQMRALDMRRMLTQNNFTDEPTQDAMAAFVTKNEQARQTLRDKGDNLSQAIG